MQMADGEIGWFWVGVAGIVTEPITLIPDERPQKGRSLIK